MEGWNLNKIKNGTKAIKVIPFLFSEVEIYRNNISAELINKGAIELGYNGEYFSIDDLFTSVEGYEDQFILGSISIKITYSSFKNNIFKNYTKIYEDIKLRYEIPNNKFSNNKELYEILLNSIPSFQYLKK
jgi:hypothetical protein